jgi:hypothetical protein
MKLKPKKSRKMHDAKQTAVTDSEVGPCAWTDDHSRVLGALPLIKVHPIIAERLMTQNLRHLSYLETTTGRSWVNARFHDSADCSWLTFWNFKPLTRMLGYTLLHMAAELSCPDLATFCLDHRADLTLTTPTGETARELADKTRSAAKVELDGNSAASKVSVLLHEAESLAFEAKAKQLKMDTLIAENAARETEEKLRKQERTKQVLQALACQHC